MTDPTEQTADPTVSEVATFGFEPGSQVRVYIDNALRAVGIDPSVPLSRLREDLAIAARARACKVDVRFAGGPGPVATPTGEIAYADTLLAYLLGGEQP